MKVVVVGNGGSALINKCGHVVDEAGVVIRMGCYEVDGYEDCVGTKTSVWANGVSVLKLWRHYDSAESYPCKLWLMVPDSDVDCKCDDLQKYVDTWKLTMFGGDQPTRDQHVEMLSELSANNDIELVSWDDILSTVTEMNLIDHMEACIEYEDFIRPSLGVLVLEKAIRLYGQVHVTGFDFFEKGWYWNDNHSYALYKHIPLLERLWFQKRVRDEEIVPL